MRLAAPALFCAGLALSMPSSLSAAAETADPFPSEDSAPVYVMSVSGPVDAAVSLYLARGLAAAGAAGAQAAVVRVNVRGGSAEAAMGIAQAILDAPLPVVLHVAPAGARAEGVGVLLMMAADASAMAPGTRLGPAAPGLREEGAAADLLRSLAAEKERNAAWADRSLREGAAAEAEEAYALEAVDLVAEDETDLLMQLQDGEIDKGEWTYDLAPAGAPRIVFPMPFTLRVRHAFGAHPGAAWPAAGLCVFLGMFVLRRAWRGLRRAALVGALAEVEADGRVFLRGGRWTADGYGPFAAGEKVRVTDVEGGTLKIEKI